MRGFQGGRPSIYTLTEAIAKVPTPALIICGDEDDACVEPSLFLKKHLPAAGLTLFPKSGHVLNLEEPALVQRNGRALHRAGRSRPLAGARPEVDWCRSEDRDEQSSHHVWLWMRRIDRNDEGVPSPCREASGCLPDSAWNALRSQ